MKRTTWRAAAVAGECSQHLSPHCYSEPVAVCLEVRVARIGTGSQCLSCFLCGQSFFECHAAGSSGAGSEWDALSTWDTRSWNSTQVVCGDDCACGKFWWWWWW
jgi:hypothetical protein